MIVHTCHAWRCKRPCPPQHLMCRNCWARVTKHTQAEVYRTVRLRNKWYIDETWAPWWIAQAQACFEAYRDVDPKWAVKRLTDELGFAVVQLGGSFTWRLQSPKVRNQRKLTTQRSKESQSRWRKLPPIATKRWAKRER